MEKLRDLALERVGLPLREDADGGRVSATVLGPRDLDAQVREALAEVLAERLRACIDARAFRRAPVGIGRVRIEAGEEADCEEVQGGRRSAWTGDRRCYRIVAQVAYPVGPCSRSST